MTQTRGLRIPFNVGVYFDKDPGYDRGLRTPFNVGVEIVPVQARGLRAVFNVGIEILTILARGLRNVFSVTVRTGENDPVEFRLWNAILTNVYAILRGK